ncbi:hypothetical protein [Silvibacterium sp.]|uniref:hypothetical protein n=1 Tax=Silvibacterium sp. TaxID=1964179 RepID=UPI0039E54A48
MNDLSVRNLSLIRALTFGVAIIAIPQLSEAKHVAASQDVAVVTPASLPEEAQAPGEAMMLHSDGAGSTYLYVEQKRGAHLLVLDVSNPSRIHVVTRQAVAAQGAYDFVEPAGVDRELIRYRDNGATALLNLRKAAKPTLEAVSLPGPVEMLGAHALLATETASSPVRTTPAHSLDVVALENHGGEEVLAKIPAVTQRLVNDETGTLFLLNEQGLTVIRQLDAERQHEVDELSVRGN